MNRNKNLVKFTITALLIALGAILHYITIPFFAGMQPDMALIMLFVIMIIFKGDYKISLVAAIGTGIFTAISTKFPGGQAPNIIDKLVTMHVIFLLIMIIEKISLYKKLTDEKKRLVLVSIILPVGTLVSGTTFLASALLIVSLPAPFYALFISVVIPALVINLIAGIFLFKIVETSMRRISFAM